MGDIDNEPLNDSEVNRIEAMTNSEKKLQETSYAIKILALLQQESLTRIKTAVKKQCDPEVDEMVQRLIDLRVAVADYSVTVADQQRTEMNPETEYKVENITAIVKTILPELEQLKQVDDIERGSNTANKRKNAQASSSDDKESHQMEIEAN